MRSSITNSRDAALRRLARINRWLIAGSVALTAVLSEVAAQAFPGRSTTAAKSKAKPSAHHASQPAGGASTSPGSLQPPAHAPSAGAEVQPESPSGSQAATPPETSHESAPAQEAAPAPEAAPAEQTHESAPAPHESAPAPEPAPAHESAPAQEPSAPVVSGGS